MEIFVLQPWKRRHFCKVPATKIHASKTALQKSTAARLNDQKNTKSTKLPPNSLDFLAFSCDFLYFSDLFVSHQDGFTNKTIVGRRQGHFGPQILGFGPRGGRSWGFLDSDPRNDAVFRGFELQPLFLKRDCKSRLQLIRMKERCLKSKKISIFCDI